MKIKNNSLTIIPLSVLLITILGFAFRVFMLDSYPNGFARDEAYLGYNSYSLLKTAKDINGNFLPLFIESFLYTPAGYSYFSIPFIAIFGLNIFSVRIVSAIFGSLTIPLIYFLTKELFNLLDKETIKNKSNLISIVVAGLLSFTPWHINLSRTASVSTLVTFFILLGAFLFVKYSQSGKNIFLYSSFIIFLLSQFFYIAPYTFNPLLILIMAFIFSKGNSKFNKKIFGSIFIVFLVPLFLVLISHTLSLRIQSLSLTKDPVVSLILQENAAQDGVNGITPIISRVYHNKVLVIKDLFLENYFSHLNFSFLFQDKGFPDRYRIPEVGLLYVIFLPFFILGLYYLARSESRIKFLLPAWILISFLGSGFSRDDVPNLQRTLFALPPILIIVSYGVVFLFGSSFNNIKFRKLLLLSVILITIIEVNFYFHQYYFHENSYRPWYRQEGYDKLIQEINKYKDKYKKTVITNRESAPTIFLLFFNKFDPSYIQKVIEVSELRDTDRISFSNYEISQEECPLEFNVNKDGAKSFTGEKGVLYINSGFCNLEELEGRAKLISTIFRSDNSKAFYMLEVK